MEQNKKLIIEVSSNHDMMMKIFDDALTESKGFSKIMLRSLKGQYHIKSKALYNLFRSRCKNYVIYEDDKSFRAIEEGKGDYINLQYARLNNFLQSDESTLNDNLDYQKQTSNRAMWRAFKKLRVSNIKDKLVSKALSGIKVNDLMIRYGIIINYKIE